jgi:hypothetical protein
MSTPLATVALPSYPTFCTHRCFQLTREAPTNDPSRPTSGLSISGTFQQPKLALWVTFLYCSSSLCLCRNRATFALRAFVLNKSPIEPALSNSSL